MGGAEVYRFIYRFIWEVLKFTGSYGRSVLNFTGRC